jgi:hypothetical protein
MDTWNREELYAEIWEQPATKVAAKYGISSVMLGRICSKLQIPCLRLIKNCWGLLIWKEVQA